MVMERSYKCIDFSMCRQVPNLCIQAILQVMPESEGFLAVPRWSIPYVYGLKTDGYLLPHVSLGLVSCAQP